MLACPRCPSTRQAWLTSASRHWRATKAHTSSAKRSSAPCWSTCRATSTASNKPRRPQMEIVKHLHQRPGRMARTGALQSVEDTGPSFPAIKPDAVHHRSLRERGDDFLMRRYCIDLGPRECASALHMSWTTLIKRAKELEIDHRRESWKNNKLSLGGWRKQAAERLGVIERETT